MEAKKRKSKEVSVLTEDKQVFGIIISNAASFEEAFKYPITSLPLRLPLLCYIKQRKLRDGDAMSTRYLQNAAWIVDGIYAIRLVKPNETYNHYFVIYLIAFFHHKMQKLHHYILLWTCTNQTARTNG